jgi:hypothetical protein
MRKLSSWCGCVGVLVVIAATSACNINPFQLGGNDGSVGDDADVGDDDGGIMIDAAVGPPDAAPPDACIPTPEVCDEMDNDCDGTADNGFNLQMDPNNCGSCGNRCELLGAAGTCGAGMCSYVCLPDNHDINGDLNMVGSNGCEYSCGVTNNGVELCDFADNDCNDEIDEGFNLDKDLDTCGGCGRRCLILNAVEECNLGVCGFTDCDPGFADILPLVNGCEYTCPVFPVEAETCNGVDDDCDGTVDELPIAGLGADCVTPGFETEADKGLCDFGTVQCVFGVPTCLGYVGPQPETCDLQDNDCNDVDDNGFDKLNDPRYCGDCTPCALPNTQVHSCTAGTCGVGTCAAGFHDNDPNIAGCEYPCTNSGPEVCDGRDNDCDGGIDNGLTPPSGICKTNTACSTSTIECTDTPCDTTVTWRCQYPDAETDACDALLAEETRCDEIDGDCDGLIDESFTLKNTACEDTGVGICQGTGAYICNPADSAQVLCDITTPGQSAGTETCNNLDDDCDNDVDEEAPGAMVGVPALAPTFWIDVYEASRPDADATRTGNASHRACSKIDAMPWVGVTYTQAVAACAGAGKRLCTEAEWQGVCEGSALTAYPYGNTYDAMACNGKDYDHDCAAPNEEELLPTGTPFGCLPPATTACISAAGVIDLSGNAREWTSTLVSTLPDTRRVKGGSFNDIRQGLTCQRSFISFAESIAFPNLGFRCCSDTDPVNLP